MKKTGIKEKIFKLLFLSIGNMLPNKGKPLGKIGNHIRCILAKGIGVRVGEGVVINRHAQVQKNVVMADYTGIGDYCLVQEGTVFQGRTLMAPYVSIYTENHYYDVLKHEFHGFTPIQPVIIGANVWLCRNAVICPGARVGNNSIVAAGAVVTGEFPDGVVLGGVPAVIQKVLDPELYEKSKLVDVREDK